MVRYILADDVALRSWWRVPYAYITRMDRQAIGVSPEEFDVLLRCDGEQEIEDSPALQSALRNKLCIALAGEGDAPAKNAVDLKEWQRHRSYDNRYVPALNWEITSRCNYNCIHCFNAVDANRLRDEFSYEEAIRLLDDARDCGILAFTITGGEPLVHPRFMDIVRGIYKRNMWVFELNTNGALITQGLLDELKCARCFPHIKISFDGVGFHDWMRDSPGAEQATLRAIELCVKNGFPVKAQVNFNRANADCIPRTLDLLDSLGVFEARIIRTSSSPRWVSQGGGLTLGNQELFDKTIEIAADYARGDHRMSLDFWHTLRLFPYDKSYRVDVFGCTPERFRDTLPICRGNRAMVAVGANGNVYPCLQMSGVFESKGYALGNVKTDGLKPLLQHSTYMDSICTTIGEKCRANKRCGACRHLRYCAGGCPVLGITHSVAYEGASVEEGYLAPDPQKCFFFENGYYHRYVSVMTDELGWRNRVPIDVLS